MNIKVVFTAFIVLGVTTFFVVSQKQAPSSAAQKQLEVQSTETVNATQTAASEGNTIPRLNPTVISKSTTAPKQETATSVTDHRLPGFKKILISSAKERYIDESKISASAKRVIHAGVSIKEMKRDGNFSAALAARNEFQTALQADSKDVADAIKTLSMDEANFPPEFKEDLTSIAAFMKDTPSADLQNMAFDQVKKAQSDLVNSRSDEPDTSALIEASTAYLQAASDYNGAVAKLQNTLNMADPNQAFALQTSQQLVKMQKDGRAPANTNIQFKK